MSDDSGDANAKLQIAPSPPAALACPTPGDAAPDQRHRAVQGLTSAEIAHEINNLMTLVLGSLALLRREPMSGHAQELLQRAAWGAQQAGRLMRQELCPARRDGQRPPVDVNDVVGGFDTTMALVAGENIEMQVILTGELVTAYLDPSELQLALLNLVKNAADALTGKSGRIRVETHRHTTLAAGAGAMIEVLVADTGPGMPAAVVQHATDPFFSTKTPDRGTGLGLWLVHRFVESCGGRLAIETAVGLGTKVRLLFPQSG